MSYPSDFREIQATIADRTPRLKRRRKHLEKRGRYNPESSIRFDSPEPRLLLSGDPLEAVANLDRLPATGATLVVGASRFAGTGGPSRLIAPV